MPCPQAHVLHCSHVLCAWRRPGGPFLVDVVVQGRVVHGARPRPATESIDLAVTLAIMDRPKRSRASSAESVPIFPEQLRIGDRFTNADRRMGGREQARDVQARPRGPGQDSTPGRPGDGSRDDVASVRAGEGPSNVDMSDRRSLLVAALGFVVLENWRSVPEVVTLHAWLDASARSLSGWTATGMSCGWRKDRNGWRSTFLHRSHLTQPWVSQVLRWWPTAWRAVQEVAWRAFNRVGPPAAPITHQLQTKGAELTMVVCPLWAFDRRAGYSSHVNSTAFAVVPALD